MTKNLTESYKGIVFITPGQVHSFLGNIEHC